MRTTKAPDRRAIIEQAGELFYNRGTYLVGMAELVKALNLTRVAFYGLFKGKEELIVEYLKARDEAVRRQLEDVVAGKSHGTEAIFAIFDSLHRKTTSDRFRGCAFLAATIENPQSEAIRHVAVAHKDYLKQLFARLLNCSAAQDPRPLQLLVLYDGVLAGSVFRPDGSAARSARATVEAIFSAHGDASADDSMPQREKRA
ncbi:TetR/AcrR family transcriptional regulator [Pararhizobium polonicum]|nr:TetR/AcrR family transcriptional regulator [Pararhizobium polonicum]